MAYERKNIAAMTAYVPGEQIIAPDILKLNTNENPYPPSPSVAIALTAFDVERVRRYPPPTARNLQDAIASKHGLETGNVIVTNGGDELLRMAIATFVETSDTIAVARPTYTLYQVLADAHGCNMKSFELDADWGLPDNYGKLLNDADARLSFLVNPHAPSGMLTSIKEISVLANTFDGVLLLDEAYIDFVDSNISYQSEQLIKDHDNILILRTFSKGYSLAGLRMAYGLGSKAIIEPLMKTKDSYNTDLISQTLAQAALEDQDYAQDNWNKIRQERQLVTSSLKQAGYNVPDSQSNFILATVPENKSAEDLYRTLKDKNILVRYFNNEKRLEDKLRITIGTPEENRRLLDELLAL